MFPSKNDHFLSNIVPNLSMELKNILERMDNVSHISKKPVNWLSVNIAYTFSNGIVLKGYRLPIFVNNYSDENTGAIEKFIIIYDESRHIILDKGKFKYVDYGKHTAIFEDASLHMEEIENFYYLAKLLDKNIPAFRHYLKENYVEEKDYPILMKETQMVYKWNIKNEYKDLFLGFYSIMGSRKKKCSSVFWMGFYTDEKIDGFIPSKGIDVNQILPYFKPKGEIYELQICSFRDCDAKKIISPDDDQEEALKDLLDMLENIELLNKSLESSENLEEGYLSYLGETLSKYKKPKSARSDETGLNRSKALR